MTRLRVDRFTVTSRVDRVTVISRKDRLMVTSGIDCLTVGIKSFAVASRNDFIYLTKSVLALLISISLLSSPVCAAPSSSLGIVVYADRAHVGVGQASVGTTVFSGDRLSTEQSGSVQVRTGAARFVLSGASTATFSLDGPSPAATLASGSATFSTANSNAFALHVASAVIRPNSDHPTIGQVTVLNPKELIVKSTRGSLSVAVEDDVREIPEGAAYRVVLDPKAAKSRFIWYAIGVTAIATYFVVSEAFESPDRP